MWSTELIGYSLEMHLCMKGSADRKRCRPYLVGPLHVTRRQHVTLTVPSNLIKILFVYDRSYCSDI